MANQILAGAVVNAGMVIAGVDADNPPFVGSASTSSTVANKIFMWSSDAAGYQSGTGRSDVGGVVMTDGDFSNPTTIQSHSPQTVVGGEGKVVTIAQLGEIKVYDESTGQLEQTFNDSYLDSAKANAPSAPWDSSNDAVIGAGKIFISSPEQNPNGIGSIIVVDLLDRNVATYLITPTLGNYSRLSSPGYGGIRFIDGRIYGHTSQWSSDDQGIWHFAPDGSDEQFIPTPGATSFEGFVKWGDNFVVSKDGTIEVIDSSGTTLHSVTKNYPSQTYEFGKDLGLTSTGKLVVSNKVHYNPLEYSIFLYDEGLTNEIEFKPTDIANGIASSWGYGTVENSGGFEVFGEYILVSAKEADNNGITNCGAVYRYNDSGVLQDIFYGTVADQKIGTNISVGTATATTAPVSSAPSAPTYLRSIDGYINQKLGQGMSIHEDYIFVSNGRSTNQGELYIYDATDLSVAPVIFDPPQYGGQDWGSNHYYDSTRKLLIVGNGYANLHSGSNSGGVISFYDLTDINNIVTLREFGGPGVNQYIGATMAVGGGKVYTSKVTGAFGEPNVLYSFDIDDIQSGPVVYDKPSHVVDHRAYWGRHMDADDEYLYVWDQMGDSLVYIYDVNNPLTLVTTAKYPVGAGDINYRPVIAGDYWIMTRYGNPAVSIFEKGTGNLVKVIGKNVDWLNSGEHGVPAVPAGTAIDTYPTYGNGARMYGKYLGLWSPTRTEYGTAEYDIDAITFYDTTDWSADPIVLSFEGRGGGEHSSVNSSSIAFNPVNNELWWGSGNHNGESSVAIFDASSIVGS